MDRNTITGIILIFAIFIGFSIYNNARLNKAFEKKVELADSLYKKGDYEKARTEYIYALNIRPNRPEIVLRLNELNQMLGITGTEAKADSLAITAPAENQPEKTEEIKKPEPAAFGPFAAAAQGMNDTLVLENSKIVLKIIKKGGRIYSARLKEYQTYDKKPLVLFSGDSTNFGLNFFTTDNKPVQTNELYFSPVGTETKLDATSEARSLTLRLMADTGSFIEYTYRLEPDRYMVDFTINFVQMNGVLASNQSTITLDWRMLIPQKEKGRQNEDNYTTIKYKYFQDEVDGFRERGGKEAEKKDISTKLTWIAFKDQFFSCVVVNKDFFQSATVSTTPQSPATRYLRYFTAEAGIPFNALNPQPVNMQMYFGPNHFTTLRKEGYDLDQLVTLGKNITRWINKFIIIPIFNWLNKYIASYGLIILILTIIIKIVLFPLTFKSYQSQAKMAVLKPLVDELGKKFPKKEDAMKKQQATMDLYKRAGVNPMGGCLPLLLQMPILFAMFRFFPTSIELRQEPFLWAADLSTYDSILTLPFTIPLYGSHVSLFTLLMTASTLLTMKMTGSSPGSDQPGMKVMMYMMPVMFMLILNNLSSALTYYYFLANMITYIQNVISKRFIDADKVLATLEENKKKPIKKSKWQQRLEEAARSRGINPPKR
jgi:YidC/Oxa1 family membrane protein insertase